MSVSDEMRELFAPVREVRASRATCHPRESEEPASRAPEFKPRRRGVLDRPIKPGDDSRRRCASIASFTLSTSSTLPRRDDLDLAAAQRSLSPLALRHHVSRQLGKMPSASLDSSLPSRKGRPLEGRVICPTGSFSEILSSPPGKNISLYVFRKSEVWCPRPASTGGALRDRHDTRGGMRWTLWRRARWSRVDERRRCGRKIAWSWPPDAEVKLAS